MSRFYTFNQNNSGGRFHEDEISGIGAYVIIEANSADEANERAESIGLYWNGVDEGRDCDCCGDRWSPVGGWRTDDGNLVPMIYSKEVFPCEKGDKPYMDWDIPSFIHYLDGTIRKVKANAELRW